MRPSILNPLFASVDTLNGIGSRFASLLKNLCGTKVVDLLWHLPSGIIDRRCNIPLISAQNGQLWTGRVRVVEHIIPHTRKQPYRIVVEDNSEQLILIFFKTFGDNLSKQFQIGTEKIISGKIEIFNRSLQMAHPDYIVDAAFPERMPLIETVYPLTAGITNKMLNKQIFQALQNFPDMPEWLDERLMKQENFSSFKQSLWQAHHPQKFDDLSPNTPFRRRLAYDELLANQLSLAIVRQKLKKQKGITISSQGKLKQQLLQNLPFKLTLAQQRSIAEIENDMQSDFRMLRLLQGDVGSGKTIVALITMLNAVECGYQAAIMAPTEILAQQHYESLSQLCNLIGVKTALLTGSVKGKLRKQLLQDLTEGNTQILIGTHALFTEDVTFKNLAYIIVDEQHRFGVKQRLSLSQKGELCDVLVMTATPIPRTLVLTQYGDMEYSKIDELPSERKPVTTTVMPISKIHDVVTALEKRLKDGTQAYWVCPLVEESEKIDLSAATERYQSLQKIYGSAVGLVHGKMKENEKNAVMEKFKNGSIKLLVSTTVIEVGVNVPSATIMIVEHAERFGLAQLHQLRGRIKRGNQASSCILMYGYPLSDVARQRLNTMKQTEDGFIIAEEDLKLRGGGEILGTRQSGFNNFRIADLSIHSDLLQIAYKDAAMIINQDHELQSPRGQNLRTLLYLFEQDEAIRTYKAG
ncbi:MAG: ATP-dependent DNA helicase RecG [Alphaproteobacteria bacterium]|nr:ATP-dependent DNA helicase RecG [Alphaproteobacteria bacterium]